MCCSTSCRGITVNPRAEIRLAHIFEVLSDGDKSSHNFPAIPSFLWQPRAIWDVWELPTGDQCFSLLQQIRQAVIKNKNTPRFNLQPTSLLRLGRLSFPYLSLRPPWFWHCDCSFSVLARVDGLDVEVEHLLVSLSHNKLPTCELPVLRFCFASRSLFPYSLCGEIGGFSCHIFKRLQTLGLRSSYFRRMLAKR